MRGHLLVGLTAYRDAHVPVPAEFSKPVCAMCLSRDSWPKKTLTDASVWWQSQYGYSLSLSTASDILSARHQHLDSGDFNPKVKKGRTAEWTILEAALSDWAIRFDQAHGSVTGDLIRLKATELWIKLPLYQGLECPTWSNGWLG